MYAKFVSPSGKNHMIELVDGRPINYSLVDKNKGVGPGFFTDEINPFWCVVQFEYFEPQNNIRSSIQVNGDFFLMNNAGDTIDKFIRRKHPHQRVSVDKNGIISGEELLDHVADLEDNQIDLNEVKPDDVSDAEVGKFVSGTEMPEVEPESHYEADIGEDPIKQEE
jgi:hypothetical protein